MSKLDSRSNYSIELNYIVAQELCMIRKFSPNYMLAKVAVGMAVARSVDVHCDVQFYIPLLSAFGLSFELNLPLF